MQKGGSDIKQVTIRLSDKLHKAIKLRLFEDEKSIQEFFVELAKEKLNFTDDMDDLKDYLPPKK